MDPYKILEVPRSASDDEIKKAYRKLSKKYHPDNSQTGDEEKFKEINNAYEILSDKNKRAEFDNPFSSQWSGGFNPFADFFRNQQRQAPRNIPQDVTCEINAPKGTIIEVNHEIKTECRECDGYGGEHMDCSNCNGTGFVVQTIQRGPMVTQMSNPCPICQGKGYKVIKPCTHCEGKGYNIVKKVKKQEIPKGEYSQLVFVYPGQGEFGGNLVFDIRATES